MQAHDNRCAICECKDGAVCRTYSPGGRDALGFDCEACGQYEVSRTALVNWFGRTSRLNARQSAALAYAVHSADRSRERPMLTTDWLERFVRDASLPSPALQAANLVRTIGDHVAETGEGYFIDGILDAPRVGAFNQTMFYQVVKELIRRGTILVLGAGEYQNPRGRGLVQGNLYSLSLSGWEQYEAERRGKISGRYGFLAMKFNDEKLDLFAEKWIKPPVKEALDFTVVDLRNVAKAGIIDNIMREQIRDAAFVIVDLTHDNPGAYWEAGYAEGLGKPVIYLCERAKFDSTRTHFDTNHCTTVLWSVGEEIQFSRELIATLRRSLNLFPSKEE